MPARSRPTQEGARLPSSGVAEVPETASEPRKNGSLPSDEDTKVTETTGMQQGFGVGLLGADLEAGYGVAAASQFQFEVA